VELAAVRAVVDTGTDVRPSNRCHAKSDPEVIIYRFPGVFDDGSGDNLGVATVFHCTNFSGVTENLRFVTRDQGGDLLANKVIGIAHLMTLTTATHQTTLYNENSFPLGTSVVAQGTTAIAATSINIICTAVTINAAATVPVASRCAGSGSALFRVARNRKPASSLCGPRCSLDLGEQF
jgi:hypothetical protein